jgi:hypothetical protein
MAGSRRSREPEEPGAGRAGSREGREPGGPGAGESREPVNNQ